MFTFAKSYNYKAHIINMNSIRLTLASLLMFASTLSFAQGPNNSGTYYQNANGKSGAALKTALGKIINPHTNVGYDGLFSAYEKTDKRPDGKVRDWYSCTTKYNFSDHNGYKKEGDCYTREHSVPQSWFGSGVIKSDVVHVVPTDGYVNNRRSNYPFGEVSNITYQSNQGYSKLGSCKTEGYSGTVFEPNDAIKGDIARIYFYMVTCYESNATGWGHDVFTSSAYPGIETWALNMFLRWSKQDPIDAVELARNSAVYEVQGNRNPYVDYPGLEDYVWGSKKETAFSYNNYQGGGDGPVIETVSQPMFSPAAGTYNDEVTVTLTTATDGATIYYTTNNETATEQSTRYTGPFTLTETATVKAIAVKDGTWSLQSSATYIVKDSQSQGEETAAEGTIALNNDLYGTSYSGVMSKDDNADLTGTQYGVTVTYSLGTSSNRYVNDTQTRLYPGNTLTVSVTDGQLTNIEFELAAKSPTDATLSASTGATAGYAWSGNSQQVVFSVSSKTFFSSLKFKVAGTTTTVSLPNGKGLNGQPAVYDLQGRRVGINALRPGVYIRDGKKIFIR